MITKDSHYHRFLRISSLVCAVMLLFESGLVNDSTIQISKNTHMYLANVVGMSASVTPTELNQYTAALTQKEHDLNAREAAIREIEVNLSTEPVSFKDNDRIIYILAGILFILLVLILLNYSLDFLRARESQKPKTV